MSRGGRRGGGGKKGPDMSWDDEEPTETTPNARKPGLLFPDYYIPVPKALTESEKASVKSLVSIRDRIRRGPLYAVVDPTITQSQTKIITNSNKDQPPTKPNPRAGFDPFTDQEKYTMKYHRKKRTVPDLSERGGYTLKLFPLELWAVMDPKHKMKEWASLTDEQKARMSGTALVKAKKRKREAALKYGADDDDDDQPMKDRGGSGSEAGSDNDDGDEDALSPAQKRKKNPLAKTKAGRAAKQKKGLDAEDDYPDVDQQDEEGEGNAGEDEPQDSEFETDEDDELGADDYNGEQYFDDGADEMDGGGDDDDGGGGGGGGGGVY